MTILWNFNLYIQKCNPLLITIHSKLEVIFAVANPRYQGIKFYSGACPNHENIINVSVPLWNLHMYNKLSWPKITVSTNPPRYGLMYDGAQHVPIATPCIWRKLKHPNMKRFLYKIYANSLRPNQIQRPSWLFLPFKKIWNYRAPQYQLWPTKKCQKSKYPQKFSISTGVLDIWWRGLYKGT